MRDPRRLTPEIIMALFSGRDDLEGLAPDDSGPGLEDDERAASLEEFGLREMDRGASALLAAFPGREDLVIRVSEEADGWLSWVCNESHPIRPEVMAIGWTGDVWVSIAERLEHPSHDDSVEFCRKVEQSLPDIGTPPEDPDIALALGDVMLDDLAPRNVMRRSDGQMVLNDPQSFMGFARMKALKEMFDIRSGLAPEMDIDIVPHLIESLDP